MNSDNYKINAILVLEVLGKPKEHLVEVLEELAKRIGEEKGVTLVSKNTVEPVELEKNPGMFTCFSEIEIEIKEPLILAILMFKYMPAHIDIVSPEYIPMTNKGYNDILNELVRRLHGYDHVARVLQAEKAMIERQLGELKSKEIPTEKPIKDSSKKKVSKKKK